MTDYIKEFEEFRKRFFEMNHEDKYLIVNNMNLLDYSLQNLTTKLSALHLKRISQTIFLTHLLKISNGFH